MYSGEKFDLAGFCVGVVSREKIIDGRFCRRGDAVLGLASSGLHSNGFSLVRKIFSSKELAGKLGSELLRPTRIYAGLILKVMEGVRVKAMAHITGGGFYENIPRVLPGGLGVRIEKGTWPVPPIFGKIQERARLDEREMFRTFNMGVGMVLIVGSKDAHHALKAFKKLGQRAWIIGEVFQGKKEVIIAQA
jgi:phosphoribosylformylglycinamidine cyclo-ligase